MSRLVWLSVLVALIGGCSIFGSRGGAPAQRAGAPPIPHAVEASEYLNTHDDPRLAYLQARAREVTDNAPIRIYVLPSMFVLMQGFARGEVDPKGLERSYVYFERPQGRPGGGPGAPATGFECRYVDDVSDLPLNRGTGDVIYEAHYVNARVDADPFIIWVNQRPHVGDRLGTDFLMYFGAIQFESETGKGRRGILFVRPPWAGETGYVPAPSRQARNGRSGVPRSPTDKRAGPLTAAWPPG